MFQSAVCSALWVVDCQELSLCFLDPRSTVFPGNQGQALKGIPCVHYAQHLALEGSGGRVGAEHTCRH